MVVEDNKSEKQAQKGEFKISRGKSYAR